MLLLDWIGLLAAMLIGVSLGLIGGGGSILTVPVLVYFFNVEPLQAMSYSLFIVGLSSLAGVIPKFKAGHVCWRAALVFGLPSMLAVLLTRKYIVPSIPAVIHFSGFEVSKSLALMLLFSLLMLVSAWSMIKEKKGTEPETEQKKELNFALIFLQGMGEGTLTGLVGAGGGFLIIPALVMLSGLPMKKAIGTSLLIIGVKSMIGFTGDLTVIGNQIDWTFLLKISAVAMVGILIGNLLSVKVDGKKLKKGFGYFVLLMALFILWKEIILK